MRLFWRGLGLSLLAIASGCGKGPTPTAPCTCPSAPVSFPSPAPGASQAPSNPAEAAALVAKVQQGFNALPGFALNMRWWQKKGSKTAQGLYKVEGKAPKTMRVEVLEGNGQGTRLLYTGGNKVKVRAGGLLGAIAIDLDLKDERIRGIRGYTMDEFNIGPILTRFSSPRNQVSLLGEQGGKLFIKAEGADMLEGCVRMVAGVDAKSLLPRYIEMHDAQEMVVRIDMGDFRPAAAPNLNL
jgi:hypothetical protein